MSLSKFIFLLAVLLAACGDLPRPYQGAPGATAMRLAQPPASRIAVVRPAEAGLPTGADGFYQQAIARALQDQDVPAIGEAARPGDWRLLARLEPRGATVIPIFTLVDPAGEERGTEQAAPVPLDVWKRGVPETLKRAAMEAAPRLASLLARVEAVRRQNDPRSLTNAPLRAAITEVSGAPGDGNIALPRLLRDKLSKHGQTMQESAIGADFTIQAVISDTAVNRATRRIEITWLVYNARNEEIGKIVQANDVPAGTLDHFWGDVAVVVTEEAAIAIRDMILAQPNRTQPNPTQSNPPQSNRR